MIRTPLAALAAAALFAAAAPATAAAPGAATTSPASPTAASAQPSAGAGSAVPGMTAGPGGAAGGTAARTVTGEGGGAVGPVAVAGGRPAEPGASASRAAFGAAAEEAGRWIVVLRDGAVGSPRALAAASGGAVEHVYESAVRGYSARLTPERARALAADPRVDYLEPDREFRITDDQHLTQTGAPWGLDRIDQRALPLSGTYTYADPAAAAEVTAYVVDTGIEAGNPEFGGRASTGFTASDDLEPGDCNGHGTHVAGTIGGTTYGVAKRVRIVAVHVADCRGTASTADVLAGIDWVSARAGEGPAVANMSMGGPLSQALNDAIRRSVERGIAYTVAAGNEGGDACTTSPAAEPTAVTVGASDTDDSAAGFSNHGPCLDLYAPGVDVTSAGRTPGEPVTASGTSMAAPHVAGVIARHLAAHPAASPAEIDTALRADATPGALTGVPEETPNLLLHAPAG
ncbi:S8 family peptidase [Streptomyces sp. NPDC101132]|uniref:S8 family peptidase n=1 Tax=Streptomyces sp. NPDC101132 TaxID=3366110 RepID=UPI00382B1A38